MIDLKQKAIEIVNRTFPKHLEIIEKFFDNYNQEPDFVTRLMSMYNVVEDNLVYSEQNPHYPDATNAIQILLILMESFDDESLHLSEVKTMCLVAAPYTQVPIVKEAKTKIDSTYQKMKDKIKAEAWQKKL